MTETIVVLCTCASEDEAGRIAAALVGEEVAACVNILPRIRSIYRWQGLVEDASEVLLLVKSTADRFEALRDRIAALHSYDTPEIIALPIVAGSERYLAWIKEQVH